MYNCVTVEGSTKSKRNLVREVAYFCIEEMLPRFRTLDVEINLIKLKEETNCDGLCSIGNYRNHFEIDIEKGLEGDDLITCVAHEMAHVMQYAKGMLKDKNSAGSEVYWRGYDYSNYEYCRQPWERQAYRMQESLLIKYKEWSKNGNRNT